MVEYKNEDYLPQKVYVEKNLSNKHFKVIAEEGFINYTEEQLFKHGLEKVVLKNNFGKKIKYHKHTEEAEIIDGIPKAVYTYETNKRMYDEELRRK